LSKIFDEQAAESQKASDSFLDYTQKMEGRIQSMNAAADTSELGQIKKHFEDLRGEADREYDHRAQLLEEEHLDQQTFSDARRPHVDATREADDVHNARGV
jgi:hypothetical protein